MAIDMFVNIEDNKIKGECIDKAHPDTIRALTWNWHASRNLDFRQTGNAPRGRASYTDLTFTKCVDRSSPLLLDALATAMVFKHVELTLRKSGGALLDYMVYTLENVMVSSIHSGVTGSEERQLETVTLNFLSLTSTYQAQAADGGKAGGLVEAMIRAQPTG